jgi:hypothetical protein
MPEEAPVRVLDFSVGGGREARAFAGAFDAEDILDFVLDVVSFAGGVDEVGLKMFEFRGFGVDLKHVSEKMWSKGPMTYVVSSPAFQGHQTAGQSDERPSSRCRSWLSS